MRFHALACDYDGTLARDGLVDEPTLEACEHLLKSGRKLILVTGRELGELLEIFPQVTLFERVVAENGALLYDPATRTRKHFGERPSNDFIDLLRSRGVAPLAVGHTIVATWHPHETTVVEIIQQLGLELHVIFNKGAVMILPANINKASGLREALADLNLSPHEVVGIGDAENDHAFLTFCECSVAVANALPAIKERVDLVTHQDHGAGVAELIDDLVANDLAKANAFPRRHLLLGHRSDNSDVWLSPYGMNLLIAGPSASGKSTTCTSLLERLLDQAYQFVVIDPEGDYDGLPNAVTLGNAQSGPRVEEVLQIVRNPASNAVVNLVGMPLADRPAYFSSLLPRLQEMRARLGRPHWIVIDETHHLMPTNWAPGDSVVPRDLKRMVFITVHPEHLSKTVLDTVDVVIAVGKDAERTLAEFAKSRHNAKPRGPGVDLDQGEVLAWPLASEDGAFVVRPAPTRIERRRHTRKYAEGELGPERSFYFRGPEGKLNLRAQNLILFLQLAAGVDEETWMHHLRQGDYSRWIREQIKDDSLADTIAAVESARTRDPRKSRELVREAIEAVYTAPVDGVRDVVGEGKSQK